MPLGFAWWPNTPDESSIAVSGLPVAPRNATHHLSVMPPARADLTASRL
jgi:hypothetical protein